MTRSWKLWYICPVYVRFPGGFRAFYGPGPIERRRHAARKVIRRVIIKRVNLFSGNEDGGEWKEEGRKEGRMGFRVFEFNVVLRYERYRGH